MIIEKPYIKAFLIALFLFLELFKKKLTVIGIMGHTHGVSKANNPPRNPKTKIIQYDCCCTTAPFPTNYKSSITGSQKGVSIACCMVIVCDGSEPNVNDASVGGKQEVASHAIYRTYPLTEKLALSIILRR